MKTNPEELAYEYLMKCSNPDSRVIKEYSKILTNKEKKQIKKQLQEWDVARQAPMRYLKIKNYNKENKS